MAIVSNFRSFVESGLVTVTQETCIVVRSYPVSIFVAVSVIIGIFTGRLGAILKFGWDQNQYLVFGLWPVVN